MAAKSSRNGNSFYRRERYSDAIDCYMWAIKLTLASGDDKAIKQLGSVYERCAYGNVRRGYPDLALDAGYLITFLNHDNIVGWITMVHCAWILNKMDLFEESAHSVNVLHMTLKKIHSDMTVAVDWIKVDSVSEPRNHV